MPSGVVAWAETRGNYAVYSLFLGKTSSFPLFFFNYNGIIWPKNIVAAWVYRFISSLTESLLLYAIIILR